MAHLDPSRTALELKEPELTAAIKLGGGGADDPALASDEARAAVAELERAGIVQDGGITGYPARILAVLADPDLRLMIERFTATEPEREFAAVRDVFGVWGRPLPDGSTEFTPIEPELIPWEVSRAVGLGPRAKPRLEAEIRIRASVFEEAVKLLAAGEAEAAIGRLSEASSLDAEQRGTVVQLLYERRLSWRAFSVWRREGEADAFVSVAAIDGGDSGYWLSEHEQTDVADDPVIRLTPTTAGDVWERIVDLVPGPPSPIATAAD